MHPFCPLGWSASFAPFGFPGAGVSIWATTALDPPARIIPERRRKPSVLNLPNGRRPDDAATAYKQLPTCVMSARRNPR